MLEGDLWLFQDPLVCWHVVRETAELYNNKKKNPSLCSNWLHIVKSENRFVIHSIAGHFCLGITTQTRDQSHLLKIINSNNLVDAKIFYFWRSQHILFSFLSVWFMEGWGNERISNKLCEKSSHDLGLGMSVVARWKQQTIAATPALFTSS